MMSLAKFEEMLKTNDVYFFDTTEFEEIIHHYLDEGNSSMAKKAIYLALEQHPDSVDIKLIEAEVYIFEDQYDKAQYLLENLKAIYPSNEEVYVQIANLLSKQDKHEQAIESLKIAEKYTDDLADISLLIGMEYLFLDKFHQSRKYFSRCLEQDLEDYHALYNIIYCYEMESEHEHAIGFLNSYIDKNPYCEVAWHQLGRQYYVLKKYEDALKAFDYAVVIEEEFLGAYIEKAKALEKLERYDEAIENYKITLTLEDPTSFAYLRIGECYSYKKQLAKAIHYYKKAVHEDPLLDKGWMVLALAHIQQKEYDKALHYANKALALDETNADYWKCHAEINLSLQFYEEAAASYEKCIRLGLSGVTIWIQLADVWTHAKKYTNALEILIRAKKQHQNFAEIEYRLGCLLFLKDKRKEAYLHLKTALSLDPNSCLVVENLFPKVFEDKEVKRMISNALDNSQ
ncbi:tetratricopeptide repeat protein [Ochrovirga pacifica]|uniref:tetratricopeptide repeat protein n=1 Tax=Ochrovirga pacifica TaxID=1042376 RepID=UPI000255874A|nr:tetratricopeptide repeat protein [Ochrovirga pacifica]